MDDKTSSGGRYRSLPSAHHRPTETGRVSKDIPRALWRARSFWAVALMLLATAGIMAWVIARFNDDQSLITAPTSPVSSPASVGPAKRVLILNSFNPGYRWTDNMMRGINEAFGKSGMNIEASLQFMDMKRILPSAEHSQALKDALRTGYRGVRFDAVLACDNDALEFLRPCRDELFPGVPLVFASINDFDRAMLDGRNDLTGTSEDTNYRGTIDDALKLRPATRKVVVVVDETTTGKAHRSAVRKLEPEYAGKVAFEFLSLGDSTLEELADKLAALPSDCVVLLLQHFRDRAGTFYSVDQSTPLLTSRCSVPCFVVVDIRVGLGALGGSVESGYRHGSLAAGMVVDILKGKDVRTIPVMLSVDDTRMYDYAVLRRFGISSGELPPSSVVLGEPGEWLRRHSDEAVAIGAVIVLLSVCVGLMGYQVLRRRRSEEALRHSEQHYRTIVDQAADGIFIMNLEGKILEVNEAFANMHGYSVEELLDVGLDGLDPGSQSLHADRMARVLAGETLVFEVEHARKNGSRFPLEVTTSLVDIDGRKGIIAFHRDMTEREQSARRLQESEGRFRALTALAPVGIYLTTPEGCCEYANPCWCRMAGLSLDEALGEGWMRGLHPDDKDMVLSEWGKMVASDGQWGLEFRFQTPAGKITWVHGLASARRDAAGTVIGYVGVNMDITDRKRAEEQLLHAQKMEAIGQLAGGIAHDFRNQLTVIQGFAEMLLRRHLVKEEGREKLEHILKAAERSAATTGQLLAYSRREILCPRVQCLNDCVTSIGKVLSHMMAEDIHLVIRSGGQDTTANVDAHLFQQSIMNLATNARDAMPAGGTLTIETTFATLDEASAREIDPDLAGGPYVVVSVSDTGEGMDESTLARAFDPFFTTKAVGKGTGLGLAMVYGFVKQSGGGVVLHSRPGQGTAARLYFRHVAPARAGLPSPGADVLPGGSETILVVEDEPGVRMMAEDMLQGAGYRVLAAASAEDALAMIDRHEDAIDMLVSDIVMPGLNGVALAERLRARFPDMALLLVSGYHGEELAKRGVEPTTETLTKPFDVEALLGKVRQALDARASGR